MALDTSRFQGALEGALKTKTTAPPAKTASPLLLDTKFTTAPQNNSSVTTPQVGTPGDNILGLVNPLKPTQPIRPFFGLPGEEKSLPFGGPVLGLAVDTGSRILEALPAIVLSTLATYRSNLSGGKPATISSPFDPARVGITQIPQAVGKGQEYQVPDVITRLKDSFSSYEKKDPGNTGVNIARATLETTIGDVFNALIAGDLGHTAANAALRATAYDPEVEKALQQLGLSPKNISMDSVKNTFITKGKRLVASEDWQGLNDLGQATNTVVHALNGRGIPALNKIGQSLQDVARLGLQDARYGFSLARTTAREIAPEKPIVGSLPGNMEVPGQAPAFGLSIRKVQRVGGEYQPAPLGQIEARRQTDGTYKLFFRGTNNPVDIMGKVITESFPSAKQARAAYEAAWVKNQSVSMDIPDAAGPLSLPPAAQADWETNFQDEYARLEQQISTLQQQAKSSPVVRRRLAPQIESLIGQQAKIENAFISKWTNRKGQQQDSQNPSPTESYSQYAGVPQDNTPLPPVTRTPEEVNKIAKERADVYWNDVLSAAAADGKAIVIGADDLKDYFGGDYNDINHPVYSRAAFLTYERALSESKSPDVILTGGGPGAGKTEVLVNTLKDAGYQGIIYDSNMSSYEGVVKQIDLAKQAGKNVQIYGILPNLDQARVFTILREQKTGRGISDKTFARGHAGFPATVKKLLEKNIVSPDSVNILDVRKPKKLEEVKALARSASYAQDPLALLTGTQYNEEELLKKYAKTRFANTALQPPGISTESRPMGERSKAPDRNGANTTSTGNAGENSGGTKSISTDVLPGPQEQIPGLVDEIQSYEALAEQAKEADYELYRSSREEEQITDNLTSVFADLHGITVEDLKQGFTAEDLENARMHYEFATDALIDHPGRALMKYVSRQTGRLPDVGTTETANKNKSTSVFSQRGDVIVQELLGQGAVGTGDMEAAQELVDQYRALKEQVAGVQMNLRNIRKTIRLQKLRDNFVESSRRAIAREVAKDVRALSNLVASAERAGYVRGRERGARIVAETMRNLKNRRSKIVYIQKKFNLTDRQMLEVRGGKDPRFMDTQEFDSYLSELEIKARHQNEINIERMLIDAQIREKELKNTDNLRVALELPPLSKMTLEQLREFDNALSLFQQNDSFLGPRMIQTVGNTDLGPVKTVREIRDALAKQAGVEVSELGDVRGAWYDKFLYDAQLAQRNPLYKIMVSELVARTMQDAQTLREIRLRLDDLATAARKSRKRGFIGRLVPQDQIVFGWLETAIEEKPLYEREYKMTPQELEYARFVEALYRKWRDILIEKNTLKKWRENYVTHITRGFFEQWKDDGLIRAIGNSLRSLTDTRVDFEAVGDTGEVLGLEKFFKYSLPREGVVKPSQNVASVVMSYGTSFYKKQSLDAMIPKLEAYSFSLQRAPRVGIPKDPTGLGIDGRLRKFVRQWLNNKKGRRIEGLVGQGTPLDSILRAFKMYLALHYLGINITIQVANIGGEMIANFSGMTFSQFGVGGARLAKRHGRRMLKKYPGVVGEAPYEKLISASQNLGDTLRSGFFIISQGITFRSRGQFFLGLLTKEEYRTGIVSPARQAEIHQQMNRFLSMPNTASLVGSTTEGQLAILFKTWAVPFLFTAGRNLVEIERLIADGKPFTAAKSKQLRELMKLMLGGLGVYLFWNMVFQDPKNTFFANLAKRLQQDLASGVSAIDPTNWTSFAAVTFVNRFSAAIKNLVLLETYSQNGNGYKKGQSKGIKQLESLLTPGFVRQFSSAGAPVNIVTGQKTKTGTAKSSKSRVRLIHP